MIVIGREKVKFMTFGFPVLRFLYSQVHAYVVPRTTTSWKLRNEFSPLTPREQEMYDQESLNRKQLLDLRPDKWYELADLDDDEVLDRALRLLYLSKFGREELQVRVGAHVNYI